MLLAIQRSGLGWFPLNQQMLDIGKPDLVLAFPGGSGTADMVAKARAAGVGVLYADSPRGEARAASVGRTTPNRRGPRRAERAVARLKPDGPLVP